MTAGDAVFPHLEENSYFAFPLPEPGSNVVGSGGNLSPGMLLSAYAQGIFPWYNDDEPLLWWSPDPRFVLYPQLFHTGRRFVRFLRACPFHFTVDTCFDEVISACAAVPRKGQKSTWITAEMKAAYIDLFERGYAHSVEVWHGDALAGGLYGVAAGTVFCGESMFSRESDASRAGFTAFMYAFAESGGTLVDSQVYTDYVASFGAVNVSRDVYLRELAEGMRQGFDGGKELWRRISDIFPHSSWWNTHISLPLCRPQPSTGAAAR